MARKNGNTIKRGHGWHPRVNGRRCACGSALSCAYSRQARHIGANPNACPRCNGATVGALTLVG